MFDRMFRRAKQAPRPSAVRCADCRTPLLASAEQRVLRSGDQQMWLFCPNCLRVAGEVFFRPTLTPDLGDTHAAGNAVWADVRPVQR